MKPWPEAGEADGWGGGSLGNMEQTCVGGLRCFPNTQREVGETRLCNTKKEERDGEPASIAGFKCYV